MGREVRKMVVKTSIYGRIDKGLEIVNNSAGKNWSPINACFELIPGAILRTSAGRGKENGC